MNKIENYLGVDNHDIKMANNSQELKSYVASILCENDELQQENQKYKEVIDKAIEILQIGVNTYNNGGSRTALFEVISDLKDILKEVE